MLLLEKAPPEFIGTSPQRRRLIEKDIIGAMLNMNELILSFGLINSFLSSLTPSAIG
jgi:hypothetical protein